MTKRINGVFSKMLILIIVVLCFVAFNEMITSGSGIADSIELILGELPFAEYIIGIICKLMDFHNSIPNITSGTVISDFLKLAVMASIQPTIVWLLSIVLLKIPNGSISEREAYMESWSYRMKRIVITVLTAPIIAIVAAHITTYVSGYLNANLGSVLSSVIGTLTVLAATAISTIPMVVLGGVAFGTALLWRVVVTLLGKMAITMGINAICLWLYLTIIRGIPSQTTAAIVSLVLFILIMETGLSFVMKAVASTNLRK